MPLLRRAANHATASLFARDRRAFAPLGLLFRDMQHASSLLLFVRPRIPGVPPAGWWRTLASRAFLLISQPPPGVSPAGALSASCVVIAKNKFDHQAPVWHHWSLSSFPLLLSWQAAVAKSRRACHAPNATFGVATRQASPPVTIASADIAYI